MKTATIFVLVSAASSFSPSINLRSCVHDTNGVHLNLFGGKKTGSGDKGAVGGMMDQLTMFKKAQEIAAKKQAIEKELQLLTFSGESSNKKARVTMKYIPSVNPLDPVPEFEVQGFDFDDDWFTESSPEDIAVASTEAYRAGVEATILGSDEKFKVLAEDLKSLMAPKN
jgi:hypothetical protein